VRETVCERVTGPWLAKFGAVLVKVTGPPKRTTPLDRVVGVAEADIVQLPK
jgi:hypothetical protein